MPRKDPFAGIHLSEQASAPKLDQRLFTSPSPPVTSSQPAPPPAPAVVQPKPAPDTRQPPQPKPPAPKLSRFDLDELPLYKASFVFTQQELEALEDLKLELRRELDTKVTKNDLIRAALHLLLEDHRMNTARSYATRKMRKP